MVLSQSATLRLHYTVSFSLREALFASYTRTKLLEDIGTRESVQGRKENFWRAGVRVSYALTRTVSLAAEYLYQRRDSNLADTEANENRVTVSLSSGFPIF
jgi:uncharacterized protein (PEP-CTERM system associated)